jgi:hypothetical protein
MGLVTWTAVFQLPSVRDAPTDVARSINGLVGAQLQRELRPKLRSRDWDFAEAWPENHGWHSEGLAPDQPKAIGVSLVVVPELDAATPEGGALESRWRVVIAIDVGWLPLTKTQRLKILMRLAHAVEESCFELGATGFVWEVGGA